MTPSHNGWMEALAMIAVTTVLLLLLGSTGKVNLGFYVPFALPPLRQRYRRILKSHFAHYHTLSKKEKSKFDKRLQYFIYKTHFGVASGHVNDKVTREMKVIIGACIVQVTLVLQRDEMLKIRHIFIHQGERGNNPPSFDEQTADAHVYWSGFHSYYLAGNKDLKNGLDQVITLLAEAKILKTLAAKSKFSSIYAANREEQHFAALATIFFEDPSQLQTESAHLYRQIKGCLDPDVPVAETRR